MVKPTEIEKEVNEKGSIKKFIKTAILCIAVFALLVLIVLGATGKLNPVTEPIVFITDKTCQFVVMGDTSRAICSDGSQYKVELLVNPLP
jgi:hypothetical protein